MAQPFHDIASQYDFLNDVLSLGLHRIWKKKLVNALLNLRPHPSKVLDLATGTGDVAALFAKTVSEGSVIPVDPCPAMMEQGKKRFPHLKNWTVGSAETLPFPNESISLVTCTFGIRNFQKRLQGFQEIARILEPGGLFGILEIHPIPKKLAYWPFRVFWEHFVPKIGAFFQKRQAYEDLRDTGARFISAEDMVEELSSQFELIQMKSILAGGLVSLVILQKR